MHIDLDNLRIFYEVAKAGSFTAAGRVLNISQSALSRTILNLEARLGYPLFIRHSKGLSLTLKGERLYSFACKVVTDAAHIFQLLNDEGDEPHGELKIVTTPYLGSVWLPQYLAGFIKKYPSLHITILNRLDNIDTSHGDVAIRTPIPHHPHLIQRHLKAFHSTLWASLSYLKEYGTPKSAQDLDNHRLLTFAGDRINPYGNVDWILNIGASVENQRIPFMQTNSFEGLINLASQGLGIIEIPEEYISLKHHNLIKVLPELKGPVIETHYIYPEKMKHSKRITALIDYLEETMRKKG